MEFRIRGIIGWNLETRAFREFMAEVENEINSNSTIIERAKEGNRKFAKQVRKILENSKNDMYVGKKIAELQRKTPRWSCLKNLEFDGKKYTAMIDEIEMEFRLEED